jgi:hypothetical protein
MVVLLGRVGPALLAVAEEVTDHRDVGESLFSILGEAARQDFPQIRRGSPGKRLPVRIAPKDAGQRV